MRQQHHYHHLDEAGVLEDRRHVPTDLYQSIMAFYSSTDDGYLPAKEELEGSNFRSSPLTFLSSSGFLFLVGWKEGTRGVGGSLVSGPRIV